MCCRSCYSSVVRSGITLNAGLLYSVFSIGFAVAWCYITPIACWFIANGSNPQVNRRIFRYSWTVAACLLAQIVLCETLSIYLLPTKLTSHFSNYRSPAHNLHNLSTHPSRPKRGSRPSTFQVQPCRTSFTTPASHEPSYGDAFPKRNYKHTLCAIKCTPTTIWLQPSSIVRREPSKQRCANGHTTAPDTRSKNWDRSIDY